MKKTSTLKIKNFIAFYGKAFGTLALLFTLSLVSKAQAPYCDGPQTYACNQYNMSCNAVDILDGSTVLFNRKHDVSGFGGCTSASGYYTLWSTSSMFTMKCGNTYKMGFTTGVSYPVNLFIWIDLNQDNDFNDANEFLTPPNCAGTSTYNVPSGTTNLTYFDVKIPKGSPGVTRMRFRASYYGVACLTASDACTSINYGECEDYTITLEAAGKDDATVASVDNVACGQEVKAKITNYGSNDMTSVQVGWKVDNAFQTVNPITTTLKSGASANITLKNTGGTNFNFIDGVTYTLKVFTFDPSGNSDVDVKDDTLTVKFKYISPSGTPTTIPGTRCGLGKALLSCTTPYASDSVLWFNAATGGNQVASGRNALSPSLVMGANTFYAQCMKIGVKNMLDNGIGNGNSYWSGMAYTMGYVNVTPVSGMFVDSFTIKMLNVTPTVFDVYMKTGTGQGFETNAGAWTKIVSGYTARVITAPSGGNAWAYVRLPGVLLNAQTYAFHIVAASNPFLMGTAGPYKASNADGLLQTTAQGYGSGPFTSGGSFVANYGMTMQMHYRPAVCASVRVPVVVTVKPSPNSAEWKKGTPFQTTMATTNGTLGTPDVVAHGDQLTYELTPPKTYQTIGHGTSWKTNTPVVTTKKGANVLQSTGIWTFTPPIGSTPGQLVIKPTAAYEDELLIVSMRIEDMGPHYCDSTILKYIYVAPRPHADFKFNSPICDGDAVLFSDKSTILAGPLSYKWEFNTSNPADTGTTSDIVFTFPTFGTYDVKFTAISKLYGYKDSKTYQVVVTEIPKVDFKVLNACEKVAVTFKNNTTIGTGSVSYDWDFGDPSTTLDKSTLKEPGWIYAAPNAYKVTLRASANGCAISLTKNANQFATPKAGFSNPGLMCDKSDVLFSNTSTIKSGNMGYNWNFGDGGISNFASPTHQFATFAPKTVKLKAVSEFGCIDSFVKTITLFEAPLADFTWGAACNLSNTDFLFTGTKPSGSITNFNWDFSEGAPSTLENPSKKFDVVSRKQVTLSLTSNNGCSNSITKEVNVKLQSKAQFNIKDVCEDDDAVFVNTSIVTAGNLIYNWKFGDGSNSASQSPRHRYIINGVSQTFNVTLVAIVPGGCSDSTGLSVTVNAKPKSDFSFATSGRQVSFTAAQPNNTLYQWRFGDGGSSTLANTQYSYLTFPTGKYTACLAVINAAGCFSETCKDVLITGGIDKITKLSGVKVYPNPNKGNFTITVEDPKSDISIAVYNLLGDVVKTIETSQLKSTYSVDLNVANGVYMVKVTNGGLISTQKVTINK